MLHKPISDNPVAATVAGNPERLTSPGRCVVRKATWKPQVKKNEMQENVAFIMRRAVQLLSKAECSSRNALLRIVGAGTADAVFTPTQKPRGDDRQKSGTRQQYQTGIISPQMDNQLHERSQRKLAQGSARIDDAAGDGPFVRRKFGRHDADQHGKAACGAACGAEQSLRQRQNQG